MGNKNAIVSIPARVDRKSFHELCVKHGHGKCDDSVFTNLCDDEQLIDREKLMRMARYTDLYLSHESGIDSNGRYTLDRVKAINMALRRSGFITWMSDEQAMKSCIFDPKERAVEGIEKTQVMLVFITKRYSDMVERSQNVGMNINLDAGAGSASNDSSEICGMEFNYALSFKGKGFFRSIVPCVMETRMKSPDTWCKALRDALGKRFIVDLTEFDSDPEVLPSFINFIRSAVGSPILKGGPFVQSKNSDLTSTKGRHYNWLRERCMFPPPKATFYAETFVSCGILSVSRLFHCIEADAKFLQDKMHLTDLADIALLSRAVQNDIRGNILKENQEGIDKIFAEKKQIKMSADSDYIQKTLSDKAWVREMYEDESMRREDQRCKHYDFILYMENVAATSNAAINIRLEEAIVYDLALREGENMLREDMHSGAIKKVELQRHRDLADMCTLSSPSDCAAHVRRVAQTLNLALRHSIPSVTGDLASALEHTSEKRPTLVNQPSDSNWHRLLEEIVYTLSMVQRVSAGNSEAQQQLTDKGVLKVLLLLLSIPCTNTTNMFMVPSRRTVETIRLHNSHLLSTLMNLRPVYTSVAIAGVDAVRYLCRCQKDSTDLSGNNDRNVFLLGQAGAIELILGMIKQHLRFIRSRRLHGGLSKQSSSVSSSSRFDTVSDKDSVERSTQAIYSALECIFSMAGRSANHPNKTKFAKSGALDVVLMCSQLLNDSPTVFRWASKLVVLLFDEKSDKNLNGRICKMVASSLKRFLGVAGSCTGGCIAISHLAFISVLNELLLPEINKIENAGTRDGSPKRILCASLRAPALESAASFIASIHSNLSYWLIEKGAAQLCLDSIHNHYMDKLDGPKLVATAARALGNLMYGHADIRALFIDVGRIEILMAAAKQYINQAAVIAEIMFAMGNVVDISGGSLTSDDAGKMPSDSTPSVSPTNALDQFSSPTSNAGATESAALMLVSSGAVEIIQTALIAHRINGDTCLMGLHAFAKLLHGILQIRNVPLLQRMICIGTCDQVCNAILYHPERLDIYIFGCQALQLVITSPFDGITQGTQRIINADCCTAVNKGMRVAVTALVSLFSRPSVVQSNDITLDENGGRHDPLLFSGTAFFSGCYTVQKMLQSIRPTEFLSKLKLAGLLSTLTSAPVSRIRAMLLQIKQCHDYGPVCDKIILGHALMFIQAACDADQLTPEQKAEEASSNRPSCYPRRVEFFPIIPAENYEKCLANLFGVLDLDYQAWTEGKS